MKRYVYSTELTESDIESNNQIQVGLSWDIDGHLFEVKSVSRDHETCRISEDWISEDTGEPLHHVDTYNIAQDENGDEFAYLPEYADYALKDNYSWWARKYAVGADNCPV